MKIDESHRTHAQHASVEVKAEPLEHNFDEADLGKGPAAAIREAIAEGIKAIRERASAATIRKREQARAALAKGEAWAVKRYAGRLPGMTDRLFNDSGTLANGLSVKAETDGTWSVMAPANRGGQSESFDGSQMARMLQRLVELVPVLRDPTAHPKVREAIEATASAVVRKGR